MTAQIKGFVTRAEAGLRAPRNVSRNITPENGGVAPHYGGPRQPAANADADHSVCVKTWRSWQNYHMNTHGWADIAYTGGFCNHGYAFAGRGVGVRTAANGTNHGNQNFYAVTWIGGEGQTPTQEAYDAADWWINELRQNGSGMKVKPHRFFKKTGCPGDPFVEYAATRDDKPVPTATKEPLVRPQVVKDLQGLVHQDRDGLWGPNTDLDLRKMRTAAIAKAGVPPTNEKFDVKFVQSNIGGPQDGTWTVKSAASLIWWIKLFQKATGLPQIGTWDAATEAKFHELRNEHLNNF